MVYSARYAVGPVHCKGIESRHIVLHSLIIAKGGFDIDIIFFGIFNLFEETTKRTAILGRIYTKNVSRWLNASASAERAAAWISAQWKKRGRF